MYLIFLLAYCLFSKWFLFYGSVQGFHCLFHWILWIQYCRMLNCCNIQATNFHTAVILDPLIIWHKQISNLFIFKKKRGRGYNKATKKKYQCMALNVLLSENEIKNDVCFVLRFTFTFVLPLVRKWLIPELDRYWT